ncbi:MULTISPECIES: hypothetical protein [unclassified Streptomyces]|uniref:hypothetical protein n=1 Tax=unclassified Streptomyces TaxID=2593676 RepID=UPI0029661EDF|nr:hypothetical protein [Streptomyces sp. SJL17-1]
MTVVTPRVARSRKAVLALFVTACVVVFGAAVYGVLYALPGLLEELRLLWEESPRWEES